MILNLPENRKAIISYLDEVNEDIFISEFVIPFFNSQGYQVFRINSHGPGEHGKDIIFCRYVPMFFENEFLSVQAKAEKITTANIVKFGDQLKRALKIKFAPRSGSGDLSPHYAVFINARKHTNDAHTEFPQLVDSPHIKILSQENVCELIMQSGIAPEILLNKLSIEDSETQSEKDELVYKTLLGNIPAETDELLDHKLKFIKTDLSQKTKDLVIEYIYDRWMQNRSWAGTVKPMKWFDLYFDFFSQKNGSYLLDVIEEFTSTTPSFDAASYTESVVGKIQIETIQWFEDEFVNLCARKILPRPQRNTDILLDKLQAAKEAGIIKKPNIELTDKILLFKRYQKEGNTQKMKKIDEEIFYIIYPDQKPKQ